MAERFELTKRPEDTENPDEIVNVMEAIGRKRGCIVSGGRVDLEKASKIILREICVQGSWDDSVWKLLTDSTGTPIQNIALCGKEEPSPSLRRGGRFFWYLKAVRKGFWTMKVCGKLNSIARATA